MASNDEDLGSEPQPMRERSVSSEGISLYTMFNLNKDATDEQIAKAYRKLALKHHPDKNPDNLDAATAKIQEINEAYSILKDHKKRKIYDRWGSYGLEASKKFGEDFILQAMRMDNLCFKITCGFLCLITGGCFCCCACFCCCCCCGKCNKEELPEDIDIPMEEFSRRGSSDVENGDVVETQPI